MDQSESSIVISDGNLVKLSCTGALVGLKGHRELVRALDLAIALSGEGELVLVDLTGIHRLDPLCSSRLGWAAMEGAEKGVRFRVLARTAQVIGEIALLRSDLGSSSAVLPVTGDAVWSADLEAGTDSLGCDI